jgi:GNAT superfamily N-acetyltransferase
MGAGLRIRRAHVSEGEALSELAMRSKAFWGYDDAFMEQCRAELTVAPEAITAGEVWVATDDEGRILGQVQLVPESGESRAIELHMIFVEPEAIGSGVGRMLWEHAEARARALGGETLGLDADPNAVPFYERMGMRIVGESPSGSIPGRFLPRMAKSLLTGSSGRAA